MTSTPRRLLYCIGFVLALSVVGVIGFVTLEHESVLDAMLTTISAISTVGYAPPHPFSSAGKILALVLIVGGLLGMALVISILTEYFMEGALHGLWERRRMERQIARLRDHFIIAGFGRVGREVARTLTEAGLPFVVLDVNPEALRTAQVAGYAYRQEDPAHDHVLHSVGILLARGLIACADSDTNNVYVTLTARSVNPELFIVARAAFPDAEPKLYRAGANRVVSPYVMAGRHMAQMAAEPLVADYMNLLFDGKQFGVRFQELRVRDMPSFAGRTIKELHNTVLDGAFVLAVDRGEERIDHVSPDMVLAEDDRLLLVGTGEQLGKLTTIGIENRTGRQH